MVAGLTHYHVSCPPHYSGLSGLLLTNAEVRMLIPPYLSARCL